MDALGRPPLADGEPPVRPVGIDHIELRVANLERSMAFYARVFGFRVVEDARHHRQPYVIMTTAGHAYLALHEDSHLHRESATADEPRSVRHWGFVVGDLEQARASLWNLGVPLAAGTREPAKAPIGRRRRSVYVDDPDGHRVELLELWGGGLSTP